MNRVPSCDRSAWIGRICTVLALLALSACDGPGAAGRCAGDPGCLYGNADSGAEPPVTGGDAGLVPDVDASPPGPNDESGFSADACFNGLDDDGLAGGETDGAFDCDDASCGSAAICCLGETHEACCVPAAGFSIELAACGDPTDCARGGGVFGAPYLTADGLVPNGDGVADGGLVVGDALDPTRDRLTLRATLRADADCEGDCVEVAAFGLGDAPDRESMRITPDVGISLRPARREIALVVAGETLHAWRYDGPADVAATLVLAPNGHLDASVMGVPGAEPVSATYTPRPDRRLVIYGRTENSAARVPARVVSVTVEEMRCRVPSALDRPLAPQVPWGEPWTTEAPRAPSVLADEDTLHVAFEIDGDIFLADRGPEGAWRLRGSDLDDPVLRAPDGERYADPELVRTTSGHFLLLTHEVDGRDTIAVSRVDDFAAAVHFPDPRPLAVDGVADASLRAPSALVTTEGVWVAAVGGRGEQSAISLFLADAALTSLERRVEQPVLTASGDLFRFDGQEVGDPELVRDGDGLVRLYYAGRRGTRWAIGLYVTANGELWREVGDGSPLLEAAGFGFDGLSVRGPDARWRETDGVMELWYGATDGARRALAFAEESR
ncbi:MAG: hypothetical protein EVA89_12915 [Sandaracinaceae bacterium]|nr:MAG: hypothetical protein EVA89_12915 [Sandaracinaceae bacterium]